MAITVRRLAEHRDLGLSIVAGRANADRVVTWAHAIELADPTPYLSGGELVMTTGMNVGTTEADQVEYVSRLSAAGTAALAVDTGTKFNEVPAGVIAAGDAVGMPILKVPAATPFIAITRVVIDELTAEQLRSVQRVVDQQVVLARATLHGGSTGVVAALGRCLSASVAVVGTDGRLLASHGPDHERLLEAGAEAVRKSRLGRRPTSQVIATDDVYCTIQVLRVAQAIQGYLLVSSTGPLSATDRLLVAHAVSLISIELEKPAKVVDAEQRLRTAVTRELVLGSGRADPGVLRYCGFDPDADVVVVVLTDVGPILAAEREADRILAQFAPSLMVSIDNEVVIILPAGNAESGPEIHRRLGAQLQRPLGGGASLAAPLAQVADSVYQARTAARVHHSEFSSFGALGTFGVILGTRTPDELRLLADPLAVLDNANNEHSAGMPTLTETLEAYLRNNGQVEATATTLGIHRHTLRHRLQRIATILGRDLTSADTRAELWLSMKARELLAVRGELTVSKAAD